MKAQKNTNAEAIKQFLCLRPRTRKELVQFIAIELNGHKYDDFDQAYKTILRGYYSTFFRDCKHNGTIEKVNGKWQVTKSCLDEGNGLWSMTKDRKIEILSNHSNRLDKYRHQLDHANYELRTLKHRIKLYEVELDEATAEKKHLSESLHHEINKCGRLFKACEELREQKKTWLKDALEQKSNKNITINLHITNK